MSSLAGRWLRANKDKAENITISKGEFCQVKEVINSTGHCALTSGCIVNANSGLNWSIMPENFHPNDPKELAGRYLLCVKDSNWSDGKGRPSRGEHVLICKGDLSIISCNLSAKDMLGRTNELAKDRIFGLDPEFKLMAIGFDPNKVDVKAYPLTPNECYPTKDYPIGCLVTKGNSNVTHKVIGRDSGGVIILTLGTVGFRITDSHCKYYSVDPIYKGEQAEFLPYSFIKLHTPQWDLSNVSTIGSTKSKGCSSLQDFENPLHSSKWEFPKGSIVDYDGSSLRVIGRSDNFIDRYLLLSKGTEGTLIKSDWVEHFHIDHVYIGRHGIWVNKHQISFTKDRPENKHVYGLRKGFENCTTLQTASFNLSSQDKTSLENDPVTRKVKPPKFQHKRTAY